MASQKSWIYFVSSMPGEALAAAATYYCTQGQITACSLKIGGLIKVNKGDILYMLGTYWKDQVHDLSANHKIHIFSYGDDVEHDQNSDVKVHKFTNSIDFIREVILKDQLETPLVQSFLKRHDEMISLAMKRSKGNKKVIDHPFFTGIHQFYDTCYDTFEAIFKEELSFARVCEKGRDVIDSHIRMAMNRARNNSCLITTKNGIKVCVTNAPELINLTHNSLKEYYSGLNGDIDLTLTVQFSFNGKSIDIRPSYRSYTGKCNVVKLAESMGGGGSNNSAGASVKTDVLYQFLPD